MARLSELIKSRRGHGQDIGESLLTSLKDVIKERIDPRKFLNQMGLLVALFPQLKAFKAQKLKSLPKIEPIPEHSNLSIPNLEDIDANTKIAAKNSLVLPSMARDMFLIKENIARLIKTKGGKPATEAKEWFTRQTAREVAYENKFSDKKTITKIVEKEKQVENKTSSLMKLLTIGGLGAGLLMLSNKASASINKQAAPTIPSSGKTFNQLTKEEQDRLLNAQYKMESGGKATSIATRLNNPGAMKYAPWQKELGATKDSSGFAKFPTMEQGRDAQRRLWEKKYGDMPIEQATEKWTGAKGTELQNYTRALTTASGTASPTAVGSVTSGFGMRMHPILGKMKMHQGVDIAAPLGTPVTSVKTGTVTIASNEGAYGNVVEVTHDGNYKTRYAHLNSISVKRGDQVSVGQELGTVGSTGRSTGPHLHYEVRKNDIAVNPETLTAAASPISNKPALIAAATTKEVTPKENVLQTIVAFSQELKDVQKNVIRDKDVIVKETNYIQQGQSTSSSSGDTSRDDVISKFVFERIVS